MTPAEQLAQFANIVEKHYRPLKIKVMRSNEFRASKGATLKAALAAIHAEAIQSAKRELAGA